MPTSTATEGLFAYKEDSITIAINSSNNLMGLIISNFLFTQKIEKTINPKENIAGNRRGDKKGAKLSWGRVTSKNIATRKSQ